MNEVWKTINDTDGLYEVSNTGRVLSLKERGSWRPGPARLLNLYTDKDGRKNVVLHVRGKRRGQKVHRLVASAFCSNPKGLSVVNHIDNDVSNNLCDNLEWCTNAGNLAHSARQGRMGKLLTADQVHNIRKHLRLGHLLQKELGFLHGVSNNNICLIKTGKIWTHLPLEGAGLGEVA